MRSCGRKIIQYVLIVLDVAACCTIWNGECFNVNGTNNNNHACNLGSAEEYGFSPCCNPGNVPCCNDPTSDECKQCCITATHDTPWNCPRKQTIHILRCRCYMFY